MSKISLRYKFWANISIGATGFFFILIYTLFFNEADFCYDEPYYLENVEILHQLGLSQAFMLQLKGPAGPLHGLIHFVVEPLTDLQVKPTRMVNIVLALLTLFMTYLLVKHFNPSNSSSAFLLFSVPMIFPTTGMALTEIPAMLFFVLGLYVFYLGTSLETRKALSLSLYILGGLSLSLAILGRQPYLVTLSGFGILFLVEKTNFRRLGIILFSMSALILPAIAFYIWGGLVPETGGSIAIRKSFEISHLFLGFGYSFLLMLILAPSFFLLPSKKMVGILVATFFLLIPLAYLLNLSFIPMHTLASSILPAILMKYYGNMMFCFLLLTGLIFLHSLFYRLKERGFEIKFLFLSIILLAIVFTSIKVTHQFSSRYVFQAAPIFVLLASYYNHNTDIRHIALNILGLVIGMLSLTSYC